MNFKQLFLKEVAYALQSSIYLIKKKKIILLYILNCNLFLWWQSWIFSSHYSSFQSSCELFKHTDMQFDENNEQTTLKILIEQLKNLWKTKSGHVNKGKSVSQYAINEYNWGHCCPAQL